jgi:hypothetical protein
MNVPIALGCVLNQIDLDLREGPQTPVNTASKDQLHIVKNDLLIYLVDGMSNRSAWQGRIKWKSPFDANNLERDLYWPRKR